MNDEVISIYAGGANSGIMLAGNFSKISRDDLKFKISTREERTVGGVIGLRRNSFINENLAYLPSVGDRKQSIESYSFEITQIFYHLYIQKTIRYGR